MKFRRKPSPRRYASDGKKIVDMGGRCHTSFECKNGCGNNMVLGGAIVSEPITNYNLEADKDEKRKKSHCG